MKASIHAAASVSTGTLLWLYTKSPYAGILLFMAGFLIDVDHIIDYVIHHGWKGFTLQRLFLACEQTEKQQGELMFEKIHLFFH